MIDKLSAVVFLINRLRRPCSSTASINIEYRCAASASHFSFTLHLGGNTVVTRAAQDAPCGQRCDRHLFPALFPLESQPVESSWVSSEPPDVVRRHNGHTARYMGRLMIWELIISG